MDGKIPEALLPIINDHVRWVDGRTPGAQPPRRIEGCDFSGVFLRAADFSEAEICNVDFRGADLTGVSFFRARLYEVQFGGAALDGACFHEAHLAWVDLPSSVFCDAGCDFVGAKLLAVTKDGQSLTAQDRKNLFSPYWTASDRAFYNQGE